MEYKYHWIPGEIADEQLLQKCSQLYSKHYGKWSDPHPDGLKGNVKINTSKIRNWISSKKSRIAYCECGNELIGYAFCIQVQESGFGIVSWITQLVVHEEFRKKDVAKKILFSIWGMSQHDCWGLVTANPYAVRALEKATRRRVIPKRINKNHKILLRLGKEHVSYIKSDTALVIDDFKSVINTEFFIDHSNVRSMIKDVESPENKWLLGIIEEGWEWFAFTFTDQETISLTKDEIEEMLKVSDEITRHAYGRMTFDEGHKWASKTTSEVNYVIDKTIPPMFANILDVGCGVGRHSIEFAARGYSVTGIDYAENLISRAIEKDSKHQCDFLCRDFRFEKLDQEYDLAIALYDVIGSYPSIIDNTLLLTNMYRHLKMGSYAVISVMNINYLLDKGAKQFSISSHPDEIQKIKSSNNMQSTGEVFDTECSVIDMENGVVYRKEIFEYKVGDTELPEELLVRDKRFYLDEITALVQKIGFKIIESKYVRLGRWNEETASDISKEILLVLKK
jgi:2-polyprenyl-3-methyl-5-hydroxy-6-metoxy-1,4-benzoquinol methylase